MRAPLLAALLLAACATPRAAPLASEAEIAAFEAAPLGPMASGADWNAPFAPFNIIDNIYYVGPAGVSSFLIRTPDGLILIDGGLAQSAPIIIANIAALGFDIRDVKYLLASHAHFDHAGGLARLQRASGATFVASAADRAPFEAGRFPYGPSKDDRFAPLRVDRVVADGETLSLGGVTLTAHLTPGHTPGCTSWSLPITGADGAAHTAFIHCSATTGGQSVAPESYPGMVADYRTTFARTRTISADVFLAAHGNFFDLAGKRARQIAGDANAFVDPDALQRFNAQMEAAFNAELARQQAAAASPSQ
ncbi:MAG: subclass B3 metallo-beta-lactamase [Hyphomonadaceae bacterium]|nr:subclass B3 metallo-beta-lactamase [Hyphomonadaceae bacterium]